ncbi:MAG: hypothetical protein GY752_09030 [bacterium]|nr:hypothetical protein [bacterium]
MSIRIEIINAGPEPLRSASITGVADRQATNELLEFVSRCSRDNVRHVLLDLSDLVSIDQQFVSILSKMQLKLRDRAGGLHLVGPVAIVSWVLESNFGKVPLLIHQSRESAVEAILNHSSDIAAPVEAGDKQTVPQWLEVLKSTGLCTGGRLCVVKGDIFVDLHDKDLAIDISTTLAKELQSVRTVMKTPTEREGLTIFEIAFLRKCNADMVVPLLNNNKVVGVLMLQSGRAGSLAEYRSGELLALNLVGMKIAELLSVKTSKQSESSLYLVPQL